MKRYLKDSMTDSVQNIQINPMGAKMLHYVYMRSDSIEVHVYMCKNKIYFIQRKKNVSRTRGYRTRGYRHKYQKRSPSIYAIPKQYHTVYFPLASISKPSNNHIQSGRNHLIATSAIGYQASLSSGCRVKHELRGINDWA